MLKSSYVAEEKPNCFGKMYSSSAPECIGGHDPAYLNEENESRTRDRCNFASSCAAQMQAYRNAGSPVHVPVSNLTRPVTSFTPTSPAVRPIWQPAQPATQPPTWQQQQAMQQMMPINHYMPQYLTVRQPPVPGQSMAKRLLIESGRSIGKSLGHTIAHFFDVEVFGAGGNKPNGG